MLGARVPRLREHCSQRGHHCRKSYVPALYQFPGGRKQGSGGRRTLKTPTCAGCGGLLTERHANCFPGGWKPFYEHILYFKPFLITEASNVDKSRQSYNEPLCAHHMQFLFNSLTFKNRYVK